MIVQKDRCTGCGDCVDVCPQDAIVLIEGVASIDQGRCTDCGACVEVCPVGAIVPAEESLPVPRQRPMPKVVEGKARPLAIPSRPSKILPAVGAALAVVGREIAPRLVSYALGLLDRPLSQPAEEERSETEAGSRGGRRRRRRRRGS